MRLLNVILAFYFLLLAVFPCGDALAHSQKGICIEQFCEGHYDADTSDHPEADTCSPLCMCNCCGGIALLLDETIQEAVPIVFSDFQISYSQQVPAEISFSIWQPPKLG